MQTAVISSEWIDGYLESCYGAFLRGDPRPDISPGMDASLDPEQRGRIEEVVERLRRQAEPERCRRDRRSRSKAVADGASREWPDVPGYDISGSLGSGGFGRVYRAISHHHFGAPVALKVVGPRVSCAAGSDEAERSRLLAYMLVGEARILAHIGHPNVVRYLGSGIIKTGPEAGTPFIVTELIDGPSLARRIGDVPQDPRWSARIMADVADALEFVHQLKVGHPYSEDEKDIKTGILHRDVKPANILLGREDQAYLTDFGLAGRVGRAPSDDGILAGTPAYLAPEQLREDAVLGPAVDVYGLGATLHHLLNGRPPKHEAPSAHPEGESARCRMLSPRRLARRVPVDLERVCLKCLEEDPSRRYPTAGALRDDLRRFLEGRPVSVHPVGPWGRSVRWARRNPLVASMGLGLVMALGTGLGVTVSLWRLAETDRRRAEAGFELASQTQDWLPTLIYGGSRLRHNISGPGLLPHLRRAREQLLTLLQLHPHNPRTLNQLAEVDINLGEILSDMGELSEARALLVEALVRLDEDAGTAPLEPATLWKQSAAIDFLIRLARREEQVGEAISLMRRSVAVSEILMKLEGQRNWKLYARLADQRYELARLLAGLGDQVLARALLEANLQLLVQTPDIATNPALAIRRIFFHEDLRRIAADGSHGQSWVVRGDGGRPLSFLISAEADHLSADDWAQLFITIVPLTPNGEEPAPDYQVELIYDTTLCMARRTAERRNAGRPDEAERSAAQVLAFARRLHSIHPNWAVVHLALSEAYLQAYKNACRTQDGATIKRYLNLAGEAANQALLLEPDNRLAQSTAIDRKRRLRTLPRREEGG